VAALGSSPSSPLLLSRDDDVIDDVTESEDAMLRQLVLGVAGLPTPAQSMNATLQSASPVVVDDGDAGGGGSLECITATAQLNTASASRLRGRYSA